MHDWTHSFNKDKVTNQKLKNCTNTMGILFQCCYKFCDFSSCLQSRSSFLPPYSWNEQKLRTLHDIQGLKFFIFPLEIRGKCLTMELEYMHYEPPGQNVSIVSQICLIFVSNCLKRSQFCLKHVSDKMSQFGLNLRHFWHLRHNLRLPLFESNLRAIWDIFLRCQKGVKKVSNMSQKGIWEI